MLNDRVISSSREGFIFAKPRIKPSRKVPNLQYWLVFFPSQIMFYHFISSCAFVRAYALYFDCTLIADFTRTCFQYVNYGKCSEISNTFRFLYSKVYVTWAEFTKLFPKGQTVKILIRLLDSLIWVCAVCLDLSCRQPVFESLVHPNFTRSPCRIRCVIDN